MGKKNVLTFAILIAMIGGVLVGYGVNQRGGRYVLSYTADKDFAGIDSLTVIGADSTQLLPIFVTKEGDTTTRPPAGMIKAVAGKPTDITLGQKIRALRAATGDREVSMRTAHGGAEISSVRYFSDTIKLLSRLFINLVQMIIAPLVFSTLVVGIAKLGDMKSVGRVGGKAILWFVTASLASLLIGLVLVNYFKPGQYINLGQQDTAGLKDLMGKQQSFSLQNFLDHVVPHSFVEAMANNEMLQIVVFSVFFGIAAAAIGDFVKPVIKALEAVSHVILKMVGYVMNFAPLGVFGAMASIVAAKGLGIFEFYLKYYLLFLLGIAVLWVVLLTVGYLLLGKRLRELLRRIGSPMLVAFSTTSSEAVFPKLTEELERFGCRDRIVAFVLPLGYSFNLDGSMMYMTFASMAIAQAFHAPIAGDVGQQLVMLLVLMLTSKGVAGVPRASLVVVLATCAMFKIPPEGVALILPIDHFCDMFRTMTNVLGNALATSAVSKWEGELHTDKTY